MRNSLLILTSIASLAIPANAAIVLNDVIAIDFGATATSTTNYNISGHTATSVPNLVRLSDGASTGVSFTLAGTNQDNLNYVASSASLGNTTDPNIFEDGILANLNSGGAGNGSTSITLTFTGLDDTLAYDLVGGSARVDTQNGPQRWVADWTADGKTATAGTFAADGYITLSGLSSTGGILVITVDGQDQYSPIAQLELTAVAVPEPSSAALLCLAGFCLILRRRK
ncbi:MAG: PEP-CTERM sorting domain-containing protein [Luteolibacter sp.]